MNPDVTAPKENSAAKLDSDVIQRINSLDLCAQGNRIFSSMKKTTNFLLHEAVYLGQSSGVITYSLKEDTNDTRRLLFASGPVIYTAEASLSYLVLYISALDKESLANKYLPHSDSEYVDYFSLNHGMFIQSSSLVYKKPLKINEKIKFYWRLDSHDAKTVKVLTQHKYNDSTDTEGVHFIKILSPDVVRRSLLKPKF